jgi:hypothetical protein
MRSYYYTFFYALCFLGLFALEVFFEYSVGALICFTGFLVEMWATRYHYLQSRRRHGRINR